MVKCYSQRQEVAERHARPRPQRTWYIKEVTNDEKLNLFTRIENKKKWFLVPGRFSTGQPKWNPLMWKFFLFVISKRNAYYELLELEQNFTVKPNSELLVHLNDTLKQKR